MNKKKQFAISFLGSLILTFGTRTFDFIYSQQHHKAAAVSVCQKNTISLEVGDSDTAYIQMNRELLTTYSINQFCVLIQNGSKLLTPNCSERANKEFKCEPNSVLRASIFFVEPSFFEFNIIKIFSIFFIILEVLLFMGLWIKRAIRK